MKKFSLFANNADKGACGHYRVIDPVTSLEQQHGHPAGFLEGSFTSEEEALKFMNKAEVFIFQRPRSAKQVAFFETFKDSEKLLVFEHDDNTWDLHPLSDHFRWHGTTDIAIPIDQYQGDLEVAKKQKTVKDGLVWLWEHGKNGYNVMENAQKLKNFETCLSLADTITTTTPKLAKLFEERAKKLGNKRFKAYWLPNCLDLRRWMPVKIEHDDIRILWQGGASHYPDLTVVAEALTQVCKKYPNVTVVFGGIAPEGIYKDFPKQVKVYDNWVDFGAHSYRTALYGADIGIVPIENTLFNSYKSDVKYTEYSALAIPTVASNLTPYKESITHGKTGLLAENTTESWVKHLSSLIESESLRKKIGDNARKWVEDNRDIQKESYRWAKVYQKEITRKKTWLLAHSSPESSSASTTRLAETTPPASSSTNSRLLPKK